MSMKVFELCLSSPTVSKIFTLLFLPFSMLPEPYCMVRTLLGTLRWPFVVRFERLHRFRTVRYPGYRVPVGLTVMLCSGCFTVWLCACLTCSALCCVLMCACAVCGVCAVLCAVCYVSTSCVLAVFSGYFGNLFGIICQKVKVYAGHLRCHFLDFFGVSML